MALVDDTPASGVPAILARLEPGEADEIVRWARRTERERLAREAHKLADELDRRSHRSDDGPRDRFAASLFRAFAKRAVRTRDKFVEIGIFSVD